MPAYIAGQSQTEGRSVGTYITIHGWLECDTRQLDLIRQIISDEPDDYNDGWAFPKRQFNWSCHAFYGASIRTSARDWFLEQLRRIAALPASNADNDRVLGLFLASHEQEGMSEWQVREGEVHIAPADPKYAYFDI
jgi:hypothetical protein